jgi:hypothetical protein
MKNVSLRNLITWVRICTIALILVIASVFLFSFAIAKLNADFLKELGITKSDADKKITNSVLGGYLDSYGIKNAANIAIGNRGAVTQNLLPYTKKYLLSEAFKKEYALLKENNKPVQQKIQSPEEMQQETIAQYKKGVSDMEAIVKKADATLKPTFEKALADDKKQLKEAEDPKNKAYLNYAKNYPQLLKNIEEQHKNLIAVWKNKYPTNYILFVKQRLIQFLEETKDIDFAAELISKNGKKTFANKNYENKSSRWKMAFRAGKEVIFPARTFVEQWVNEIK